MQIILKLKVSKLKKKMQNVKVEFVQFIIR